MNQRCPSSYLQDDDCHALSSYRSEAESTVH